MTDVLTDPVNPDAIVADALAPDDAPSNRFAAEKRKTPWEITGSKTAQWAVDKIRAEHQAFADATAGAQDAIAVLEAAIAERREFIDARADARDAEVSFWEAKLVAYHRKTRQEQIDELLRRGKTVEEAHAKAPKSWKFAGGTVKTQAARERIERDDRAIIAWARRTGYYDELVAVEPKVTTELVKAFLKAHPTVRPDGVTVVEAHEDDRDYKVVIG